MRARRRMTSIERKTMDKEILKQITVLNDKNNLEISAMCLYILHEEFGFGTIRLERFFKKFDEEITALSKRYDMNETDEAWLCTHKLKEYGIDINKWGEGDFGDGAE